MAVFLKGSGMGILLHPVTANIVLGLLGVAYGYGFSRIGPLGLLAMAGFYYVSKFLLKIHFEKMGSSTSNGKLTGWMYNILFCGFLLFAAAPYAFSISAAVTFSLVLAFPR